MTLAATPLSAPYQLQAMSNCDMATHVSELFGLGITQAGLDFVDVDVVGDVPAYIDPLAIRTQGGWWTELCVGLLQSYFESLLEAIQTGNKPRIASLVSPTHEPNETHLGQSKGKAAGRGMSGGRKSDDLVEALSNSTAAKSGLLTDLEDTALLVPTIGADTVSDVTTSVIRRPLIDYTQAMCKLHDIPTEQCPSGPIWNPDTREWGDTYVELPVTETGKLLLVPKTIVRLRPILDTGMLYRHHLRPLLIDDELSKPTSALIRTVKGSRVPVKMKDFDDAVGAGKYDVVRHSGKHPSAVKSYKAVQKQNKHSTLTEAELARKLHFSTVDYVRAYEAIEAIAPGNAGATAYHTAVAKFLSAIFEGSLGNIDLEYDLHEGRKRVDIMTDNVATHGFFRWLSLNFPASMVPIECKNYSRDPANESLDQLSGRFSRERGIVGILVCREVSDRARLLARCKDTSRDGRGHILLLDDSDLKQLATEAANLKETNAKRLSVDANAHLLLPQYAGLEKQFKDMIT